MAQGFSILLVAQRTLRSSELVVGPGEDTAADHCGQQQNSAGDARPGALPDRAHSRCTSRRARFARGFSASSSGSGPMRSDWDTALEPPATGFCDCPSPQVTGERGGGTKSVTAISLSASTRLFRLPRLDFNFQIRLLRILVLDGDLHMDAGPTPPPRVVCIPQVSSSPSCNRSRPCVIDSVSTVTVACPTGMPPKENVPSALIGPWAGSPPPGG